MVRIAVSRALQRCIVAGFAIAIAAGVIRPVYTTASTFTYTINADATFDNNLTPPYVGSATFSYDAPSAFANGYYSLSFLNSYSPTFSASFTSGPSFTLADLVSDPTKCGVYFYGTGFLFAATNPYKGPEGGSADFVVGGTGAVLSAEPLWYNYNGSTLYSDFRGSSLTYSGFRESTSLANYNNSNWQYFGNWGINVADVNNNVPAPGPGPSSVPEIDPSSFGSVLALITGALGMIEQRRRQRHA